MNEWKFRDYQRPVGGSEELVLVNEVLMWVLSLPKKAQAKLDVRIIALQATPVFPPQYVSALKGGIQASLSSASSAAECNIARLVVMDQADENSRF